MKPASEPTPLTKEQKLKYAITETVAEMTDGYCDLDKYSFDGDEYDHLEPVEKVVDELVNEAIKQERNRIVEIVSRVMDDDRIKMFEKNLQIAFGTNECKICGTNPRHQKQYLLKALENNER